MKQPQPKPGTEVKATATKPDTKLETSGVAASSGGSTPKLEQWMVWCNFQASAKQPLSFLSRYTRPVWMADHGGQWGFYPFSRGADIDEFGADKDTIRIAFDYAKNAPEPVIVDVEKFWPSGDGWGFVGCGKATPEKVLACNMAAGRAIQMIDAVLPHRMHGGIKIGAYLPGNYWDNANEHFVKLFVDGFAKLFAHKIDFILLDVYAHPDDKTTARYQARIQANIRAYKRLGLPIVLIVKYSAEGAKSDPLGFLKAAKLASESEGIKGIAFWDEINLNWSDKIGADYEAIR